MIDLKMLNVFFSTRPPPGLLLCLDHWKWYRRHTLSKPCLAALGLVLILGRLSVSGRQLQLNVKRTLYLQATKAGWCLMFLVNKNNDKCQISLKKSPKRSLQKGQMK